jgi:hypothetical protein
MPYPAIADPVPATVITAAWEIANPLAAIRWLRQLMGNADPPSGSLALISSSTTTGSWAKVPADALAADVALANLGYAPVNRASDLALVGPHGWGASTYLSATNPNQLFLVSGQMIYLVDAANPGAPSVVIDVVNKTITMAGGSISTGALTLSAALAAASVSLTGGLAAASVSLSGALAAASATLSGQARITKSGPTPSATSYDTSHAVMVTTDNSAPTLGFERFGISGITLYESGNRLFGWGADNVHGEVALATGATITNLGADKLDGANASATPGAGQIPIADGTGKLNAGWLPASGISGVPSGAIVAFDALASLTAAGAGWTRHTAADGRLLVGDGTTFGQGFAQGGSYGASWAHAHSTPAHQHSGSPLSVSGATGAASGSGNQSNVATPNPANATQSHTHDLGTLGVAGNTANDGASNAGSTTWLPAMFGVVWGRKL